MSEAKEGECTEGDGERKRVLSLWQGRGKLVAKRTFAAGESQRFDAPGRGVPEQN